MRATSLSALPDTGTITRSAQSGALDTVTGVWTPSAATEIYSGAMRVRPPTATELSLLFGDTQVTEQRFVATLPHDAAVPAIDDQLTVTVSSDDDILGRHFRVTVVSAGSFHIDRRCGLEVVQ